MNRRDSLKALAVGTVSVGTILATSCDKKDSKNATGSGKTGVYGRTAQEKLIDDKLMSETFFSAAELSTITIL
ncbi:MAG: gluconate 2-dehydrogenase subunit 3 family protein, partial [Bacteroidetes bacterium]|nr:gluconate 2-dehydrogenase subunit 3 family protein [Bacteroidota bacterium]